MNILRQTFHMGPRGQETWEQKVRGRGCKCSEIELLLGHACEQLVTTTPAAGGLVKAKACMERCSAGEKEVNVTIRHHLHSVVRFSPKRNEMVWFPHSRRSELLNQPSPTGTVIEGFRNDPSWVVEWYHWIATPSNLISYHSIILSWQCSRNSYTLSWLGDCRLETSILGGLWLHFYTGTDSVPLQICTVTRSWVMRCWKSLISVSESSQQVSDFGFFFSGFVVNLNIFICFLNF